MNQRLTCIAKAVEKRSGDRNVWLLINQCFYYYVIKKLAESQFSSTQALTKRR